MSRNDRIAAVKNGGFSLVEVLVTLVISSLVAMAAYTVFSSSNWTTLVQEDVSEAQQNARVAIDRLAKDIRASGFGLPDPPFSLTFNSVTLTSPVTVSNSSTGPDTITILGIGYQVGTLKRGTETDCNLTGQAKICLDSAEHTNKFFTSGYAFMPERKYISIDGVQFLELSSTQNERTSKKLALVAPNGLDRNYADANNTPVYIIQAVRYTVETDDSPSGCTAANPCLASEDFSELRDSGAQVLAEDIEDIQFAYCTDKDSGAFENDPSDPDIDIVSVRTSVVARTRHTDPKGATVFQRPALEDHAVGENDGYRRRTLRKVVKIRNSKAT